MFTLKIRYDKKSSIETNVKAVINMVNFLLKEMTAGRVITSRNDIVSSKSDLKKCEDEIVLSQQMLTDMDLRDIETQQSLTDMDLRIMELELGGTE